jgi:hypothetical protein
MVISCTAFVISTQVIYSSNSSEFRIIILSHILIKHSFLLFLFFNFLFYSFITMLAMLELLLGSKRFPVGRPTTPSRRTCHRHGHLMSPVNHGYPHPKSKPLPSCPIYTRITRFPYVGFTAHKLTGNIQQEGIELH